MLNNNSPLGFSRQLSLFLCWWLFGFAVAVLVIGVITARLGIESRSVLYVTTIIQDILIFLSPVATTAVLISRNPISFLQLNKLPNAKSLLLTIIAAIVSIPAMNVIIEWNASMSLPESLHSVEEWMRQSEAQSASLINNMLSGTSVGNLITAILIIGLLTGLSEELFFRGMFQRILLGRPMNVHLAIWITAIVFSVAHMQFYGFVPRLLLGAFFGYLAWWSKSLWLPVIAHTINNSLVVITQWSINNKYITDDINKIGVGDSCSDILIVCLSIVLTTASLIALYRWRKLSPDVNQTFCG